MAWLFLMCGINGHIALYPIVLSSFEIVGYQREPQENHCFQSTLIQAVPLPCT